jgi:hypothetical protein
MYDNPTAMGYTVSPQKIYAQNLILWGHTRVEWTLVS